MKNFTQLALSLLLLSGSALFGSNPEDLPPQKCPIQLRRKISDYVMKQLEKSESKLRPSASLKEVIQKSIFSAYWKEAIQIKGATQSTWLGVHHRGWGSFDLKNTDGIIEVDTRLRLSANLKAKTEQQEQQYKEWAKKHDDDHPLILPDANEYTRCESEITLYFDDKKHTLECYIFSKCKTNMPCDVFNAALERVKQQRNQRFLIDALP